MIAPGLRALVSPYVGVVRTLDELLAAPADPPLPTYTTDPVGDDRLLGAPLDAIRGVCGIGLAREAAAAAALGETAERYSLSFVPTERLVRAPAAELGAGAVEPARFGLFADEQYDRPVFPFVRFTRELPVRWIEGCDLRSGEPAWVPAELVFLADPVEPGEPRIAYATSSGAACAPTWDGAVLKGLLELCERDAFMIVWASRLSLPQLDWHGHERLGELDRRYFARTGLRYAAVDLSAFHDVPSVLGVVRAPTSEPACLGVGAGTASTVEEAWWKALSEAFACRAAAARLVAFGGGRELRDDGANVGSFDDHIVFYATPDRAGRTGFLDASPDRVHVRDVRPLPAEPGRRRDALLDRIEGAGASAYAVDVTAPDVRTLGVHVAKTVAPELCMLDVPHAGRFLGNPRLLRAAAEHGLRERPLALSEVNPDPHPFP